MQQIADWLEKLGLGQYAQRFAENEIDISVLRHLSDQDLKDIGVPLGHRRKMLAAIGELVGTAPATREPAAATEPKTEDTAERRQVTVMFSDLVGSTALSARMDPEDLREVISAYQKCVAETVGRFGGFVAKYMGDGVLVYFGYPQAHEDDAERAVRAGLELVAAVAVLKTRATLQTRVGIATGLVIVGDLIGSGAAQEQAIVGETPNLAARLQSVAEPNSVVIAEGTRKLLGNLFELEDLGQKDLKGIAGPVRAWAALRASSAEGRFEALHSAGLTALVGREEEFELLLRRWARAKSGEGQVVLLSGEAGIGKSRLTAALLEHLASEPHTRLRYFCSPQHTGARRGEIIGLQWQNVDFERKYLRLPDSKTGAKVVFLNEPALEVIRSLPRLSNNLHVIPGSRDGAAFVGIDKIWVRVRAAAGLRNVRLHDLRHSFASMAAGDGFSLPVIGALLGHKHATTTARYAHLAADPLRAANDAVGAKIAMALQTGSTTETAVPAQKRARNR